MTNRLKSSSSLYICSYTAPPSSSSVLCDVCFLRPHPPSSPTYARRGCFWQGVGHSAAFSWRMRLHPETAAFPSAFSYPLLAPMGFKEDGCRLSVKKTLSSGGKRTGMQLLPPWCTQGTADDGPRTECGFESFSPSFPPSSPLPPPKSFLPSDR